MSKTQPRNLKRLRYEEKHVDRRQLLDAIKAAGVTAYGPKGSDQLFVTGLQLRKAQEILERCEAELLDAEGVI